MTPRYSTADFDGITLVAQLGPADVYKTRNGNMVALWDDLRGKPFNDVGMFIWQMQGDVWDWSRAALDLKTTKAPEGILDAIKAWQEMSA